MQKGMNLVGMFVLALAAVWPLVGATSFGRLSAPRKMESTAMETQSNKSTTGQEKPKQKTVFACNMLALDAEQRKRHGEVMKQLRAATKEARPLKDGYAFRFPSEQSTILLVSEFVARERLCCPFFTFEMVIEPEQGPLWLRLRGADGVKEFIKAEFGIK
jgi:hypothetical protein